MAIHPSVVQNEVTLRTEIPVRSLGLPDRRSDLRSTQNLSKIASTGESKMVARGLPFPSCNFYHFCISSESTRIHGHQDSRGG